MGTSHHYCETCAKICDEAKKNLKKLEKKVQVLTIVCTASITLLGEQGAKALYDAITTFNKVTEVAENGQKEGKQEKDTNKKDESNKPGQTKLGFGGWRPSRQKNLYDIPEKDTRGYQLSDELALIKKQPKEEKQPEISVVVSEPINVPVEQTLNLVPSGEQRLPFLPVISDPYAVFFTPSTLPFDVYSTTLALGNNYGFGEYYGIDTGSYVPSTPNPSTLSVFAIGSFISTRKRI